MILGLFLCFGIGVQAAEEFGIASFYSDAFHGRKTASGELYHKDKLTAAHKDLPFGTMIKVTRLDNKMSVTVKINDRGPYIKGRIVDLSKAAAKKLDLIEVGKARVKIEVVSRGEEDLIAATVPVPNLESLRSEEKKAADEAAENIENPVPTEFSSTLPERRNPISGDPAPKPTNQKPKAPKLTIKGAEKAEAKEAPKKAEAALAPKSVAVESSAKLVRGQDFKVYDLYKIQLMRPAKGGYGVQVASMSQYENVMKQVAELQEKWFNNILISVEQGKDNKPMYKLILGPFPDRATADSYKNDLKKKKKISGFVVDLSQLNN